MPFKSYSDVALRELIASRPRLLYKFTERRYALQMVTMGTFRIGTLHDFCKIETHQTSIGDSGEGTNLVVDYVKQRTETSDTQNWVSRKVLHLEGASVELADIMLGVGFNSPDRFMFCFSETSSQDAIAGTSYDTCIEIREPVLFTLLLSKAAGLQARFSFDRCQYGPRASLVKDTGPVAEVFLKPSEYAHQREWRATWVSGAIKPTAPTNVLSASAAHLCRIVW